MVTARTNKRRYETKISKWWEPQALDRPLRVVAVGGGAPDAFFGPNAWFPIIEGFPGFELVGGHVSRKKHVRNDFADARKLDRDRMYASVDAMLEGEMNREDGADIALIVTPTAYHAEDALKIAAAGMSMLIEKPMTHTAASARQLVDVIYENNVRTALAYTQTTSPMGIQAAYLAQDLDPANSFDLSYKQIWLNHQRKAGEGGKRQEDSRTKKKYTGGSNVSADLLSHLSDMLLAVTRSDVVRVNASYRSTTGRKLEDDSMAFLELANGARGVLHANNAYANRRNEMLVDIGSGQWSTRYDGEESAKMVLERAGKADKTFHNGGDELHPQAALASFMPAGHEGSAYHYKLVHIAHALGEAVACDMLEFEPEALQRPYRTAQHGLKGVQLVETLMNNNNKGWVRNPFLRKNQSLPVDNQLVGIYRN